MARNRISSGSPFEELAGYSRAVVAGDTVYVSGTTGYDYATMRISPDPVEQTEQCFHNIAAALEQAGATLADMVRVRIFVAEAADFERIAPVVGRFCREARPANTTVIATLVDPQMKVEIEVTAKIPG